MNNVELFVITQGEVERKLRSRITNLGWDVVIRPCPPTAAQWVEFPFVRLPSGSSYYGVDGLESFLTVAKTA